MIDNEAPSVVNALSTSTNDSIMLKLESNDEDSGLFKYSYTIDDSDYEDSLSSTFSIASLDEDNNGLYEVYVSSTIFDNVYIKYGDYLFENMVNLKEINFDNFNTSNMESTIGMFMGAINFEELDLSLFNTGKVINMNSMLLLI